MVGAMAVALRRHENKGIKDSVGTMAIKKQERRIEKYLDIDRSIETIGLRTRSGLLEYSESDCELDTWQEQLGHERATVPGARRKILPLAVRAGHI